MTTTVRLHPSQHTFDVEGRDSVLEAGLKAGYRLEYGCSNGNCGDCKARLVSGTIEAVRNSDYVMGDAQKDAGVFLMCANTPTSDIDIETFETEDTDAIPEQAIMARVRKIEDPDNGYLILNLKTPRTDRLRFLAGQHAVLSLGTSGTDDMGPDANLPMASCPCDDMRIQFHVPKDRGDPFARHLIENADRLDQALIRGPYGDFILDDDATNPLVFIAAGSGFAPVRSLIEHAMSLDNTDTIHLLWFAEPGGTHYMENLVRSWADVFDGFHKSLHTLAPGTSVAQALAPAIEAHGAALSRLSDPIVYAAAPGPLLDGIGPALDRHFPKALHHVDRIIPV